MAWRAKKKCFHCGREEVELEALVFKAFYEDLDIPFRIERTMTREACKENAQCRTRTIHAILEALEARVEKGINRCFKIIITRGAAP